ncbi:MAG TPA: glycosyltransferase [Candidatus Saccharimonadales bacterium]|nr:glycosyltransferase [Candidatus Saccharimonadales bacterium]
MYWLIGLFTLEAIVEAYLAAAGFEARTWLRNVCCVVCAVALVVSTLGMVLLHWRIWLWVAPVSGYRLLNILRLYRRRLPANQLRTASVRAFGWLLAGQLLLVTVAWVIRHFHAGTQAIAALAALQLLAALVLLRTTVHTWRHAAPNGPAEPLSDRELPAVSILIPARNETEQLQQCLQSLVACNYPKLEIIVLDDCSAVRRTPEIIRSFAHDGVRFLQGTPPDETHWLSKNWAYEQLAREASGELLLFCGVDAQLQPDTLRQLVQMLYVRKKDMLSVMPLRSHAVSKDYALLQAMRYYWELSLPRRLFKRPPVLSTCWLIKKAALQHMGGFESNSRSINPEAAFARQAVVTDAYAFIRSNDELGLYSNKPGSEQYGTSVRVRYPQLHRRLELVAFTAAFEFVFLLGPLIALCGIGYLARNMAFVAIWIVALACLMVTYSIVVVGARLTSPWYGWALMPVALAIDMVMLHISFWKYEFGGVEWKGRNVCIPVMRIESRLPKV